MATTFRSERLIYRAPEDTPEDKAFIRTLLNDRGRAEQATRYIVKPMSSADVDSFLRQLQDCFLGLLICIPDPSFPLATKTIGYVKLSGPPHPHHRNSSMGIQICQEEEGKGYGTEAIRWVLDWAFQTAGLHRLSIGCFSFNEGARRLYERMGFVVEGRTREVAWKNGGWHDLIEMGLLEGEWREKYLIDGKGAFTLTGDSTKGVSA